MCQEIYSAECLMSSCVPTLNPKVAFGVYLTPNPVKQAMLEIAMHDIDDDDEMRSRLANGDFRFCDPTCGSFGFGSVALSQIDKWIDFKLVLADDKKRIIETKLRDCAFTGADAAPRMVMLARVNMALQGAPKRRYSIPTTHSPLTL